MIVVREPNGILRRANWEERYRMNQIHYPIEGKSYEIPKMFQEEHLKVQILKNYFVEICLFTFIDYISGGVE